MHRWIFIYLLAFVCSIGEGRAQSVGMRINNEFSEEPVASNVLGGGLYLSFKDSSKHVGLTLALDYNRKKKTFPQAIGCFGTGFNSQYSRAVVSVVAFYQLGHTNHFEFNCGLGASFEQAQFAETGIAANWLCSTKSNYGGFNITGLMKFKPKIHSKFSLDLFVSPQYLFRISSNDQPIGNPSLSRPNRLLLNFDIGIAYSL